MRTNKCKCEIGIINELICLEGSIKRRHNIRGAGNVDDLWGPAIGRAIRNAGVGIVDYDSLI